LQLYRALFIHACGNRLVLANQNLAQLMPNKLDLFFRYLTTSKLRVFSFGVVNKLIKLRLISRLLEEFFNLLVRKIGTSGAGSLCFKVIFRDNHRANQLKLALNLKLVANSFGSSLFGNGEQFAKVLRKILASCRIRCKACPELG